KQHTMQSGRSGPDPKGSSFSLARQSAVNPRTQKVSSARPCPMVNEPPSRSMLVWIVQAAGQEVAGALNGQDGERVSETRMFRRVVPGERSIFERERVGNVLCCLM